MQKVIIDCDPGIDDSLAIMLALKSPEIEVIGITIVCGNSPVEMGFGNAKKILKQMNRLDVPVYIGESTPLRRDYVNALDTHGEDGLGESFLPEVTGYHQQISAVDFLADVEKNRFFIWLFIHCGFPFVIIIIVIRIAGTAKLRSNPQISSQGQNAF